MATRVERLRAGEGERWRSIRLRALQEAPQAFGSKLAQVMGWPGSLWEQQVVDLATFVFVANGSDLGVARGAKHPTRAATCELISMWVDPSARRQAIGRSLIEAVADWARSQGATALVLDVMQHNQPAIALYAGSGFKPITGSARGRPLPGELRMVRRIDQHARA